MSIFATLFKIDDQLKDKRCNDIVIDGVCVENNVVYDDSNPEVLKADLYIPSAVLDNRKVLINIHGGGWISGDKRWRKGFSMLMCDNKYFVMNINYGLSPQYKYPYCIQNAFSALHWIVENAEKYHLDLSHIYLSGDSAGAQISAFTAAVINNSDVLAKLDVTRPNCDIYGLILYCGAYDMKKLLRAPITAKMCYEITGFKPPQIEEFPYYQELNTYFYIDDTFPKTVIVSAYLDAIVRGQGDILEMFLVNRRIPHYHYTSNTITSGDHCFHLRYRQKESQISLSLAKKFLSGEILENGKDDIDHKKIKSDIESLPGDVEAWNS